MARLLSEWLAEKWEQGWQPRELVHLTRRRRSRRHAELVAAAMSASEGWHQAGGAPMPEAWSTQLAALGVTLAGRPDRDWLGAWLVGSEEETTFVASVAVVLETLGVLLTLPPIEPLLPRPSEWGRWSPAAPGRPGKEDPVLAKVRALLAKAESTGFEAESEALTAKAQELMARHAIEEAVARYSSPGRERPLTRRVLVDDPYAAAKAQLLAVVAKANDVRCVWYGDLAMMAVIGFAEDLDALAVLFTSLLFQASKAMLAKGKVRDARGRSRTRSFRQSFVVAFAMRIGERLAAAAVAARTQVDRETARQERATSLEVVLASRAQEIDEEVARVFPYTRPVAGLSVTNAEGWHAGRLAAELVTLGPGQGMLEGMMAAG
jgi:hypothetical protein